MTRRICPQCKKPGWQHGNYLLYCLHNGHLVRQYSAAEIRAKLLHLKRPETRAKWAVLLKLLESS